MAVFNFGINFHSTMSYLLFETCDALDVLGDLSLFEKIVES